MVRQGRSGKRVAILGAGNIKARRLAREAAEYGPKRFILVGHDENGPAKIQDELYMKELLLIRHAVAGSNSTHN